MRLLALFMLGLLCFTLASCPKKDEGTKPPAPGTNSEGSVGEFNEGGE